MKELDMQFLEICIISASDEIWPCIGLNFLSVKKVGLVESLLKCIKMCFLNKCKYICTVEATNFILTNF